MQAATEYASWSVLSHGQTRHTQKTPMPQQSNDPSGENSSRAAFQPRWSMAVFHVFYHRIQLHMAMTNGSKQTLPMSSIQVIPFLVPYTKQYFRKQLLWYLAGKWRLGCLVTNTALASGVTPFRPVHRSPGSVCGAPGQPTKTKFQAPGRPTWYATTLGPQCTVRLDWEIQIDTQIDQQLHMFSIAFSTDKLSRSNTWISWLQACSDNHGVRSQRYD